jgi:hypothetical protein
VDKDQSTPAGATMMYKTQYTGSLDNKLTIKLTFFKWTKRDHEELHLKYRYQVSTVAVLIKHDTGRSGNVYDQ